MPDEKIVIGKEVCEQIAEYDEFEEVIEAFYLDYLPTDSFRKPSMIADNEWHNDASFGYSIEAINYEDGYYGYHEAITQWLDGTGKMPSCSAFLTELAAFGLIEEFDGLVHVSW